MPDKGLLVLAHRLTRLVLSLCGGLERGGGQVILAVGGNGILVGR